MPTSAAFLNAGMALGTGSALGHRAVDAVLGSRHPEPAQATAAAEELVRDNAPCSEQVSLMQPGGGLLDCRCPWCLTDLWLVDLHSASKGNTCLL